MSEILDNALDSLRMGLRHYLDPELEMGDKWAILELFHSIELLLKERLYEEHPLLIYRKVDKEVKDDAQTVGLAEALARFKNLGVELPSQYVTILKDLQRASIPCTAEPGGCRRAQASGTPRLASLSRRTVGHSPEDESEVLLREARELAGRRIASMSRKEGYTTVPGVP